MGNTTLYDIFKDLGLLLMMCGNADVRDFVEEECETSEPLYSENEENEENESASPHNGYRSYAHAA